MYETPIKIAGSTGIALASGAVSVMNEQTLIPLGIFVLVSVFLVGAAWKLATAVTRASDKLDDIDRRLAAVEAKCERNRCV